MRPRVLAAMVVAVALASMSSCSDEAEPPGASDRPSSPTTGAPGATAPGAPTDPSSTCEEAGLSTDDRSSDPEPAEGTPLEGSLAHLVPAPAEVTVDEGHFVVDADVELVVETSAAEDAACLLRDELARTTGHVLQVRFAERGGPDDDPATSARTVRFRSEPAGATEATEGGGPSLPEGYRLSTTPDLVTVEASTAAGHGWAVQTLIQSAAPAVHSRFQADAPISFPAGTVTDAPRYAWRGLMVDIARHWFGPTELMRVVDLMAAYKLNVLHLHLTDDQGWRLAIDAYPALTDVGAATEVGGGPGGFLTKDDFRDLVAYAQRRGITVVPEIDLPGHTNAALTAVPELNCDGVAPEVYTGTSVGFSTLCIGDPDVDEFVRTVLAEVAEMTPGPYLHVGGDEAHATEPADYQAFMTRTLDVVRDLGKVPMGWEEIGTVPGDSERVAQHWLDATKAEAAVDSGASVVLSPSSVLYFDMAYGPFAPDGNSWAGTTDTREVYEWEPSTTLDVDAAAVLGVEAAMWTELITNPDDIDLRLLPRLPALAEVAWSQPDGRSWTEFRDRLVAHVDRWASAGRAHVDDPGLAG